MATDFTSGRSREITGRHVFFGMSAAFAVIIGVNLVLATQAVRTFPGLEVKNSYVASQQFDAARAAQVALNWTVGATLRDGQLRLSIADAEGHPVIVSELAGTFGRATSVRDDQTPDFRFDGSAYVADVVATAGNWNLRMQARAGDGTLFAQRVIVKVLP